MTILSQFNSEAYLNKLQTDFSNTVTNIADITNQNFTIRNYTQLIESLGLYFQEFIRRENVKQLESIDTKYRNSSLRKRNFYIKDTRDWSIVSVFAVCAFKRTLYQIKSTEKGFIYL